MPTPTYITLSDDLVRNIQQGSVKTNGDLLMFNEYVAMQIAPFHMYHNNFNRCRQTVIATKKELSAVRIQVTDETRDKYTVDKYDSLLSVLNDTSGSE